MFHFILSKRLYSTKHIFGVGVVKLKLPRRARCGGNLPIMPCQLLPKIEAIDVEKLSRVAGAKF